MLCYEWKFLRENFLHEGLVIPGDKFNIIEVPREAAQRTEAMGTKYKFWYDDKVLGRCLYKQARENTGEDWAEKIASELCEMLNIPHALYELAAWNGHRGAVSKNFLAQNTSLIHGNEILLKLIKGYLAEKPERMNFYRVSQHKLDIVLAVLDGLHVNLPLDWNPPKGIENARDTFLGYLLLDAWISNTDRHHENWGVVLKRTEIPNPESVLHLAPTYDHASSLGRIEADEEKKKRLSSKDKGYCIQTYVEKSRSAFYDIQDDTKPLTTFDAFSKLAFRNLKAAEIWLNRFAEISFNEAKALFERIPGGRISEVSVEFGQKILELNRIRLLDLRKEILCAIESLCWPGKTP